MLDLDWIQTPFADTKVISRQPEIPALPTAEAFVDVDLKHFIEKEHVHTTMPSPPRSTVPVNHGVPLAPSTLVSDATARTIESVSRHIGSMDASAVALCVYSKFSDRPPFLPRLG